MYGERAITFACLIVNIKLSIFLLWKGPQRQVQDKTYFLGLLRSKTAELSQEINNLKNEVNSASEDQSNYVSYEKRYDILCL